VPGAGQRGQDGRDPLDDQRSRLGGDDVGPAVTGPPLVQQQFGPGPGPGLRELLRAAVEFAHEGLERAPPTAGSVPAARHLVQELMRVWKVPHDREDAALLVTELVANVVDHVGGESNLTLELTVSDDCLRMGVADGSSVRPVVQELSHDRPRGRGLHMVEAIADRWGAEDHDGGKRIWFDLRPAV
jgi:anti-sigma regulatory factor (Ser/Thr protein kinase)